VCLCLCDGMMIVPKTYVLQAWFSLLTGETPQRIGWVVRLHAAQERSDLRLYDVVDVSFVQQDPPGANRPTGIPAIAILFTLLGAASVLFALLLLMNRASLSAGAFLIGGGLEQLGPIVFLLNALIASLIAIGMWRRWKWSRQACVVFLAAGVLLAIPAISSAVVDGRVFAIAREGLQIIWRVVVVYYISRESTKEWFG
jgi:hypothetical protein